MRYVDSQLGALDLPTAVSTSFLSISSHASPDFSLLPIES